MIQYPQKLAHAVNLVVVPAVREYGEFGLEVGKPGRIRRQIDHARLYLCQLMSQPADLIAPGCVFMNPPLIRAVSGENDPASTASLLVDLRPQVDAILPRQRCDCA